MPILNTARYGQVVFLPQQPQRPMNEVLAWSTDVFTSHDGTEQRKAIRETARQSFEMNFPMQAKDVPRALNALYGGIGKTWLVGLWGEAQEVAAVPQGATEIVAVTDMYRFQVDGLALVWASPTDYSVVEVAAVGVGGLTLVAPLDRGYTRAVLLPIRSGRISGSPQRTTKGSDAVLTVVFEVIDNDDPSLAGDVILFDFNEPDWQYFVRNDRTDVFPTEWLVGPGCFGQGFTVEQPAALTYVSPAVGKSIWMRREFPGSLAPSGSLTIEVWADDGPKLWFNGELIEFTERPSYLHYFAYIDNVQENNVITMRVTDSYDTDGNPAGNPSYIFAGMRISTGSDQYLGNDIDFAPVEIPDSGMTEDTTTQANVVDYESGVKAAFYPWLNPKLVRTERRVSETPSEALSFKTWLRRRGGRLQPYWRPTFENDFRLRSTGLVGSSLLVRDDDYNQFGGIRKHIAVKLSNGQWLPRTIVSHAGQPNNVVQLNLNAPLDVQAEDIVCISYLGLHRLNTDRVEMQWGGGICTSEFSTIEITP